MHNWIWNARRNGSRATEMANGPNASSRRVPWLSRQGKLRSYIWGRPNKYHFILGWWKFPAGMDPWSSSQRGYGSRKRSHFFSIHNSNMHGTAKLRARGSVNPEIGLEWRHTYLYKIQGTQLSPRTSCDQSFLSGLSCLRWYRFPIIETCVSASRGRCRINLRKRRKGLIVTREKT